MTSPEKEGEESRPVRKRRTRKLVGGAELPSVFSVDATTTPITPITTTTPPTPIPAITEPVTIATNAQATITSTSTTITPSVQESQPPVASQPSTYQPQSAGVQIKTRKRTHGSLLPPTPVPSKFIGAARILPVKRHAMLTKEKLKLHVPYLNPVNKPVAAVMIDAKAVQVPATKPPVKKRRFTERRIGISVRSLKNTRKARKSIRKQVNAMTTQEIRKVLTDKGILKISSNPPETMLRSLMKDYLALKQ